LFDCLAPVRKRLLPHQPIELCENVLVERNGHLCRCHALTSGMIRYHTADSRRNLADGANVVPMSRATMARYEGELSATLQHRA
jgi:hypothetical protein